jgi:hypothetical protein
MQTSLSNVSRSPLALEKSRAIDNLDIEAAAQLQEQILKDHENTLVQLIQTAKANLEQTVTQHYRDYESACDIVRAASHRSVLEHRFIIDDAFLGWQRRHLEELTAFETEYALAIRREKRRLVPTMCAYHAQCKRLARQNNFEASIYSREKGKEAEQEELRRRRASVDAAFDKKRQAMIEHQKEDLRFLNTKLRDDLARADAKLQEGLNVQLRTFLALARSAIQRMIMKTCGEQHSPAEKKRIGAELGVAGNDMVLEIAGISLGQVIPMGSVKSERSNSQGRRSASSGRSSAAEGK